ncbi:hypothetical protein BKA63DRAFT_60200 [Paraphoma chrysanthemicola]|nr:hypothetical protein BKA63DRAFT_60200 [Paraphoma chrysanthemicola]
MTSFRRSARSRTTQQSYAEVPVDSGDSSGDEASSRVATRPPKRRRPVVSDSDDDSDEITFLSSVKPASAAHGRKHATASASKLVASAAKRQATAASQNPDGEMPMGDDDESTDDEFSAYYADYSDADCTEDEEDEEYIPGPDVEGEEDLDGESPSHDQDLQAPTPDLSQEIETGTFNERFEQILRKCLEELVGWAKGLDVKAWRDLPREERCMTFGSRRILSRTSVDFLMNMFLPAYSLPVQNFVASEAWTLDAILSLPDTFGDKRQGIYGNFPIGGPSRPQPGCEAYIGSAQVLDTRTYRAGGHSAIAKKYTPATLPKAHRGSLHYNDICRPGVQNNFRALSGFRKPVQRGYLYLLESVNMILFGSYNDLGRYHMWNSRPSYDMVASLRSFLGLPTVAWSGLNFAWPLYQGVPAKSVHEASPCANREACNYMTYPKRIRPENTPKSPRWLFSPEDPLGEYLCGSCGNYRQRHSGVLPNKTWCTAWAKRWSPEREARRMANTKVMAALRALKGVLKCHDCQWEEPSDLSSGVCRQLEGKLYCGTCWNRHKNGLEARDLIGQDVSCDGCGKPRSELPKIKVRNVKGVQIEYPGSLVRSKVLPGKTICLICNKFVNRNGRLRTPAELITPSRGRGSKKSNRGR